MRIRSLRVGLPAIMVVLMVADAGLAQHVGFQTAGIPQPGIQQPWIQQHRPAFPPVHTPVAPARGGTFGATVPTVIVVPAQGIAQVPLVPNFPTVIVPNQALVPGQTFFPGIINPTPVVVVPPNVVQPGFPFFPSVSVIQPVQPLYPLLGMPRADVLRHYGQPSVTVVTSSGETLYFTGGVTVIIQNGLVVGPR